MRRKRDRDNESDRQGKFMTLMPFMLHVSDHQRRQQVTQHQRRFLNSSQKIAILKVLMERKIFLVEGF